MEDSQKSDRPDDDGEEQVAGEGGIVAPIPPKATNAEANAARRLVPVDLPDRGRTYMTLAEAASCEEELARRRRWDVVRAQREEDRRWYYARIGKRFPD